jgi:hypothetical protein
MPSRNKAQLEALLQGYQRAQADPKLYQILRGLIDTMNTLIDDVTPIIIATAEGDVTVGTLPDVTNFTYTLLPYSVKLSWDRPAEDIQFFEIRRGSGSWETATFILSTKSLAASIEPLLVGSYTYQIRATNPAGNYSVNSVSVVVTIPALGTVSPTSQVIDNNVLLSWASPTTTFQIKEYIVSKDAVELGRQAGTFIAIFERSAGTFLYSIQVLDIAGNLGPSASISVTVSAPRDYVLRDQEIDTLFDGTRINVFKSVIPDLWMCVDLTETWSQHFSNRSWNTPQNQIDAGYPIYVQPTLSTGRYTKVFDYGSIFSNVLATVNYSLEQIVATVSVSIQLRSSDDAISWSSPVIASSLFATSMRYLEVQLDFTASS